MPRVAEKKTKKKKPGVADQQVSTRCPLAAVVGEKSSKSHHRPVATTTHPKNHVVVNNNDIFDFNDDDTLTFDTSGLSAADKKAGKTNKAIIATATSTASSSTKKKMNGAKTKAPSSPRILFIPRRRKRKANNSNDEHPPAAASATTACSVSEDGNNDKKGDENNFGGENASQMQGATTSKSSPTSTTTTSSSSITSVDNNQKEPRTIKNSLKNNYVKPSKKATLLSTAEECADAASSAIRKKLSLAKAASSYNKRSDQFPTTPTGTKTTLTTESPINTLPNTGLCATAPSFIPHPVSIAHATTHPSNDSIARTTKTSLKNNYVNNNPDNGSKSSSSASKNSREEEKDHHQLASETMASFFPKADIINNNVMNNKVQENENVTTTKTKRMEKKSITIATSGNETSPKATPDIIIQSLEQLMLIPQYRYNFMSPKNVIKLLNHLWMDEGKNYSSPTVTDLNKAVGNSLAYKDNLETENRNPTGLYRSKNGNYYVFYFTKAGESVPVPRESGWYKNLREVLPLKWPPPPTPPPPTFMELRVPTYDETKMAKALKSIRDTKKNKATTQLRTTTTATTTSKQTKGEEDILSNDNDTIAEEKEQREVVVLEQTATNDTSSNTQEDGINASATEEGKTNAQLQALSEGKSHHEINKIAKEKEQQQQVPVETRNKDIINSKEVGGGSNDDAVVSRVGGKERTNMQFQTISEDKNHCVVNILANDKEQELEVETTNNDIINRKEDGDMPAATTKVAVTKTTAKRNLRSTSEKNNNLNSIENAMEQRETSETTEENIDNKKDVFNKALALGTEAVPTKVAAAATTITTAFDKKKNLRSTSKNNINVGNVATEKDKQEADTPKEVNINNKETDGSSNVAAETTAAGDASISSGAADGRKNDKKKNVHAANVKEKSITNINIIYSKQHREADTGTTTASPESSIVNPSSLSSLSSSSQIISSSRKRREQVQVTFPSVEAGIQEMKDQFFTKLVVCKKTPQAISEKVKNGASLLRINETSVEGWCLTDFESHLRTMNKAEQLICLFSQFVEKKDRSKSSSSRSTTSSSSSTHEASSSIKRSTKIHSTPPDPIRRQLKRSSSSISINDDTQVTTVGKGSKKKKQESNHSALQVDEKEITGHSASNETLHDAATAATVETFTTTATFESTNLEAVVTEKEKATAQETVAEAASSRDRNDNACDVDESRSNINGVNEIENEKMKSISVDVVVGDANKKEESHQKQQQQQQQQDHSYNTTSSAASSPSITQPIQVKVLVPPGEMLGIMLTTEHLVFKIYRECKLDDVKVGDKLIKVNEKDVQGWASGEIKKFLSQKIHQRRICVFSRKQVYSSSTSTATSPPSTGQTATAHSLQEELPKHTSSSPTSASTPGGQKATDGTESADVDSARKDIVSCPQQKDRKHTSAAPAGALAPAGLSMSDRNNSPDVAPASKDQASAAPAGTSDPAGQETEYRRSSPDVATARTAAVAFPPNEVAKQSVTASSTSDSVLVVEQRALGTNKSPDVEAARRDAAVSPQIEYSKQTSTACSTCASIQETVAPNVAEPSPTMKDATASTRRDGLTVEQGVLTGVTAAAAANLAENLNSTAAAAECDGDKGVEAVATEMFSQVKVVVADEHLMMMLTSNLVVWKNTSEEVLSPYTNQIFVEDKLIEIDGINVEGRNLNDVVDVISKLEKTGNKKERNCIFSGRRLAQADEPTNEASQVGEESKSDDATSEDPVSTSSVAEITGALNAPAAAAAAAAQKKCPPHWKSSSNHRAAASTNQTKPQPEVVDLCSDAETEVGGGIAKNSRKRKDPPPLRLPESSSHRNQLPLPFVVVSNNVLQNGIKAEADEEVEFRNPPRGKRGRDRRLLPYCHHCDCERVDDYNEPFMPDSRNRIRDPYYHRQHGHQQDYIRTSDPHDRNHNEYIDDNDEVFPSAGSKKKHRGHRLQKNDYRPRHAAYNLFDDEYGEYTLSCGNHKRICRSRYDKDHEQLKDYRYGNESSVREDDYFDQKNRAYARENTSRRDHHRRHGHRQNDNEALEDEDDYYNRQPPVFVLESKPRQNLHHHSRHRNDIDLWGDEDDCYHQKACPVARESKSGRNRHYHNRHKNDTDSWEDEDECYHQKARAVVREGKLGRHRHHRHTNYDSESSDDDDYHNKKPRAAVVRKSKPGQSSGRDYDKHRRYNSDSSEDEIDNRKPRAIAQRRNNDNHDARSSSLRKDPNKEKHFSKDELDVLMYGIKTFGFGKWGKISKQMCKKSGAYFSREDVKAKAMALRDRCEL